MPTKKVNPLYRQNLIDKIKKIRLSGKMAALVGCIVGEQFTQPYIAQLLVTSDGFLMAMVEGHCGFNDFIGPFSCLKDNWDRLMVMCELTAAEKIAAKQMFENATGVVEQEKTGT
jgi:hypothetical protein